MKKSLLSALGLAFALAVSIPAIGARNANAAMGQAPAATNATATSSGSDAMATKHVKKHIKKHKKHARKHTMIRKAY